MKGRIHSVETCGTVDGPGLRYIVFTQGCPLRCIYCHNPDTWKVAGGKEEDTNDLIEDIKKYMSYMSFSNGGVTVSGGEPLIQADFIIDLFKKCKALGIHTALDTAGSVIPANIDEILDLTDLVLLDIKHIDEQKHQDITGLSNKNTISFANRLNDKGIPIWVRHVLVPGYTDQEQDLDRLGQFIGTLSNVEKVEILPYHKMGEYKWKALCLDNELIDTNPPSAEEVDKAYKIVTSYSPTLMK
ncbi:pyruvate formate-lyase-activating protein [Cytobacillus sp. IB215316]|uniref:pyruvate formate-lyase-activating protein n=1 Tax=Cytobacillus sp. IB215316 TaxID=3097354 RepID=UPI002A11F3E3|nr:pyruvate formate-lyase-activating protein [Cytobacillus sp. IB215316]MDX8360564.1 pyruvate formate-lyase-activating protein [Cytobacillus sp. IB215316]